MKRTFLLQALLGAVLLFGITVCAGRLLGAAGPDAHLDLGGRHPATVPAELRRLLRGLDGELAATLFVSGRERMPSHLREVEATARALLEEMEDAAGGALQLPGHRSRPLRAGGRPLRRLAPGESDPRAPRRRRRRKPGGDLVLPGVLPGGEAAAGGHPHPGDRERPSAAPGPSGGGAAVGGGVGAAGLLRPLGPAGVREVPPLPEPARPRRRDRRRRRRLHPPRRGRPVLAGAAAGDAAAHRRAAPASWPRDGPPSWRAAPTACATPPARRGRCASASRGWAAPGSGSWSPSAWSRWRICSWTATPAR